MKAVLTAFLVGGIFFYRLFISPLLGRRCRFDPTCSVYAQTVLRRHGPFRGGWLIMRRLIRCHPFCEGGYDPPP